MTVLQVGRRKRGDRSIKVGNFIGRLGGIEHLEEHHAVDRDHRIVLGDDLLSRNLKDLLHHVDLVADSIDKRRYIIEPGLGHSNEPPEMLDRVAIALADDLHAQS